MTETTEWRISKYRNLYEQDFFRKREIISLVVKKIDDNYAQDIHTKIIFPIIKIENENSARTFKISDNNERVFVKLEEKPVTLKNIVINSIHKQENLNLLQNLIKEQEQYRNKVPK